jgi:hypothetical protein
VGKFSPAIVPLPLLHEREYIGFQIPWVGGGMEEKKDRVLADHAFFWQKMLDECLGFEIEIIRIEGSGTKFLYSMYCVYRGVGLLE